MSTGEPWEVYFTPQELSAYNHFFNVASQSKPGIVTGTEAVQFFATSGVPNQILSDVRKRMDKSRMQKQGILFFACIDLGDSR